MIGGDGSHSSEIDVWKIIHGFQQVEVSHLFAFLFLICSCLLVEPHHGCKSTRERISFVLRVVSFCVCLLA
jgi:hypothetical protein